MSEQQTDHQSLEYQVGIVGDRRSLAVFRDSLGHGTCQGILERTNVRATALFNESTHTQEALPGIPAYGDYQEMLSQHPEINLVLETSGLPRNVAALRGDLPSRVILVERAAAGFFLHLFPPEELWKACRMDLNATQSLLSTVIDQLPEDILFLDTDGLIIGVNQSVLHDLGLPRREIMGRRVKDIFQGMETHRDATSCPAEEPLERTLRTAQPQEALCTSVDPFGRMHYFRVYTSPILEDGVLSRVVFIRRDITQRTEMENRLQQSEKLASIGELSTYIAHEIRNPLFAISGFANSLLRGDNLDEATQNKLGIILDESKRLDTILKSILNFTRPTEQRETECNVLAVARETMDVMDLAARSQKIQTSLEGRPGLPQVRADPELIKQCLINLIKNSLEAMPDGGELRISARLRKGFVALRVADTGHGIPANIRDRVFSPFFSTKGKGAGLGLAMIRKIMDDIGGDVTLTSREGDGTQITLLLPPLLAVAKPSGEG